MTSDWTAVIGISVAVMAVVQVVSLVGLIVAVLRMQTSMRGLEQRVQTAIDGFTPQVAEILDEAKAASANAQGLMRDLRNRLDTMDEAAQSVRARMNRIADTVQWAASSLPGPMKVSAPAAMAAWASVRVAGNLLDRARARRIRRRQEAVLQEAGGHIGIG